MWQGLIQISRPQIKDNAASRKHSYYTIKGIYLVLNLTWF